MIEISFLPETLFKIGDFNFTNTFLTSILTSFILILGLFFKKFLKKTKLYLLLKILIKEFLRLSESILGKKKLAEEVFPVVFTFFVFIGTANLLELFPGFFGSFFVKENGAQIPLLRSPNSDVNLPLALAIISVFFSQFFILKNFGFKKYFQGFFSLNPIKIFLKIFEVFSEFTRILSFAFRLFGNIFGGEILLLIIGLLFPFLLPLPFMILEFFVGLIQAFIFSALTLAFLKGSIIEKLKRS